MNLLHGAAAEGADIFVRPHEIAVARSPAPEALPARFVHGAAVGPVARLEFSLDSPARTVNVELTRARYRELDVACGRCGLP